MTMGGKSSSHPTSFQEFKSFPSVNEPANQLFLHNKALKKLAHTHSTPENAKAL